MDARHDRDAEVDLTSLVEHTDALLQPVVRGHLIGIAERCVKRAVGCAQRYAVVSDGIRVWDQVERRRGVMQKLGPQNRYRERVADVMHESARVLAEPLLELRECRARHRMLPASSKIGMYISTTIPPTARPNNAISTGSNMRA